MEVYLDNAATTVVNKNVIELMTEIMSKDYGNPSSLHYKGIDAERYVKDAAEMISKTLKVKPKEILFTSGGTESNNTAIIGACNAKKRRGRHIVTTAIEHASVQSVMKYLASEGFEITYVNCDSNGVVSKEAVKEALREDTVLVSVMYVNNEIGSMMDIAGISSVIKEYNNDIIFHVDAIQAYGKIKIYPKKLGIDLMSASGHKFHGPKGTGFLYINEKVKITPLIYGGGQQGGMRSGTENVPGIAGLALAAFDSYESIDSVSEKLYSLKDYFIDKVTSIDGVYVNSKKGKDSAMHIISVSCPGFRSEVLLHALEDKGVYVSSGSACSSNKQNVSATLKAMGLAADRLESTVRFSMCDKTTKEEIDFAYEALKDAIAKFRVIKQR